MQNLKFNLQLFNEEVVGDSEFINTAEPEPAQSNIPQVEQETSDGSDKVVDCGRLKLVMSENGRPIISGLSEDGSSKNEAVKEEGKQEQEPELKLDTDPEQQEEGVISKGLNQRQEPALYTDQELALALQMNNVDESRIPQQHMIAYGQHKARVQQQVNANPNTQDQQQAIKDFYTRIDTVAKERALADIGLTETDLDDANYIDTEKSKTYETALAWHKQQIANEMQKQNIEARTRQATQDAIYQDIRNFVAETKQAEPNFNKIDAMMGTRYQKLPYEEAQEIAKVLEAYHTGTITPEQCKIFQKYYEDTRVAYYAKANNLTTAPNKVKPPVVEKSGGGAESGQAVNYTELRSLNVRDRRQWIANLMQNKK